MLETVASMSGNGLWENGRDSCTTPLAARAVSCPSTNSTTSSMPFATLRTYALITPVEASLMSEGTRLRPFT